MKLFTSILFLLSSCGILFGQGVLLKPLGSDYQEVSNYLDKQRLANVEDRGPEGITAWTESYIIRYHFRESQLYKTEVVRNYEDRKSIREGMKTLKSLCLAKGFPVMDISTGKDDAAFAAMLEGELYEVHQISLGKKGYQLQEVRINLDNCPIQERSEFERSVHLSALFEQP